MVQGRRRGPTERASTPRWAVVCFYTGEPGLAGGEGGRQKGSEISVELRWDSARKIRHGEYDRSGGATTSSPTICKGRRGVSWKMYRLSEILTSYLVNSRHYDLRNSPTRTATDVSGPDLDTVMPIHETVIHAEDPLAEDPMRRLSRGNGRYSNHGRMYRPLHAGDT